MRIHCCQHDVTWEDKAANHARVRDLVESAAPDEGDVLLLPEMFATGFSMNVATITDTTTHETESFLAEIAQQYRITVLGGVVTASGTRGRNECVVIGPEGNEVGRYAKMHPFTFAGENRHYVRGVGPIVVPAGPFAVSPFVCYDLRFPEVFRTAVIRGASLFAVIANWPTARAEHWSSLLRARAIENQAYVAGVNRCGSDWRQEYAGGSVVFGPKGELVAEAGDGEEVISAELDFAALDAYRREFPALADIAPGSVAK